MSAKGQIAIVTGGHKGIGKEICRGLTAKRAKVYIASKNMEKCQETCDEIMLENSDAQISYFRCDLADFDSITKFVKQFQREEKKIHILVLNSEVMWGPRRVTKHGIEMQLGINHVAHFFLTNLLTERLEAIDKRCKTCKVSKIIVLTNVAHMIGHINFDDLNSEKSYSATRAFAQSKLANILWMREMARKFQESGSDVVVNAVNPGIVAKALTQAHGWHGYKTAAEAAILPLALALNPQYEEVTGQFFGDHLKALTINQEKVCQDMKVAAKLWSATEQLIETHLEVLPPEVLQIPTVVEGNKKPEEEKKTFF